ncbi:MAG: OmpH family outer membrane protein [Acidobacteriota bacterium]
MFDYAKTCALSAVQLLLPGALLLWAPQAAQAQSAAPTRIGILNVFRAISECAEGKAALAEFQEKANAKSSELEKKNAEIQELQKQLQNQSRTLNDESRQALVRSIDAKTTDLKRAQEDAQKEFGEMQNEIFNRIGNKLSPVVQQYAKEFNFAVILDANREANQVVYFDPAIEITDDVIKRYDSTTQGTAAPTTSSAPSSTPAPAGQTPAAKKAN